MKRRENSSVIAWRRAASTELVSSADRTYMGLPSLARLRYKMSHTDSHTHEKVDGFFLKIEIGGEPF